MPDFIALMAKVGKSKSVQISSDEIWSASGANTDTPSSTSTAKPATSTKPVSPTKPAANPKPDRTTLWIRDKVELALLHKRSGLAKKAIETLESIIELYPDHKETSKVRSLLRIWGLGRNKP